MTAGEPPGQKAGGATIGGVQVDVRERKRPKLLHNLAPEPTRQRGIGFVPALGGSRLTSKRLESGKRRKARRVGEAVVGNDVGSPLGVLKEHDDAD